MPESDQRTSPYFSLFLSSIHNRHTRLSFPQIRQILSTDSFERITNQNRFLLCPPKKYREKEGSLLETTLDRSFGRSSIFTHLGNEWKHNARWLQRPFVKIMGQWMGRGVARPRSRFNPLLPLLHLIRRSFKAPFIGGEGSLNWFKHRR